MKGKLPVTVLIAVKNEAVNLPKCLRSLGLASRVIVLDSQSVDETRQVALAEGAEVVQFEYLGGYPKKRQWAMDTLGVKTAWIMLLDADEVVPNSLWAEISRAINGGTQADAFMIRKGFHFLGQKMRFGGFSFPAIILFRRGKAVFEQLLNDSSTGLDMEVHERVIVKGNIVKLSEAIVHEDFKGLEAYIARHNAYSTWEASLRYKYLVTGNYGDKTIRASLFGNSQERRRWVKTFIIRSPFEPYLWFVYHYFVCLGFLEGRRGLIACKLRASYIMQVRAKIYELELADSLRG